MFFCYDMPLCWTNCLHQWIPRGLSKIFRNYTWRLSGDSKNDQPNMYSGNRMKKFMVMVILSRLKKFLCLKRLHRLHVKCISLQFLCMWCCPSHLSNSSLNSVYTMNVKFWHESVISFEDWYPVIAISVISIYAFR